MVRVSRLFIVYMVFMGMLGVLPAVMPVLYINNVPVSFLSYGDDGSVRVYVALFERYHYAYMPYFVGAISLLFLSTFSLVDEKLFPIDVFFFLFIVLTYASMQIITILSIPVKNIVDNVDSYIVVLDTSNVRYTPIYYLYKEPIMLLINIVNTVGLGAYIVIDRSLHSSHTD